MGSTSGYRALLEAGALAVRPRHRSCSVWRWRHPAISCSATLKGELAPIEDQGNIYRHVPRARKARPSITPTPTPRSSKQIALTVPEADRVFVGLRQSDGVARHASFVRLTAVERAKANAAGDRPHRSRRRWCAVRRRGRLPEQSSLARPGRRRDKPINLRDPDVAAPTTSCRHDGRGDARQGARLSRADRIVDTDLKLNSPQLDIVRRPGKGCGDRRRDRHARPHARDHARRPAGDALQARTASNTTWW